MINKTDSEGRNKIGQMQLFAPEVGIKPSYMRFLQSDLGQLWQSIPFESLALSIESSARKQKAHVPQWGWFDIKGALGFEVLKSYYKGMSDKKVLEMINLNESCQWFCFLQLGTGEQIKDKNLGWRWRAYIGQYMNLDSFNLVQLKSWKSELEHPHLRLTDATAYETHIAYPTSVKLLWKSCEWVYKHISELGKRLGLGSLKPQYRHYEEQERRQRSYDKSRRKTHAQTRRRIRQLLFWLDKGIGLFKPLLAMYQQKCQEQVSVVLRPFKAQKLAYFKTIEQVYKQQKQLFDDPKSKIESRIVSLHQPHIRPIVRGKEVKKVEFGPKVNMLRIGGINLIEKFSFDNFNESTRFERACSLYDTSTGTCRQMGADAIYATNANRRFVTKNQISTCFIPKGKQPADEDKKQDQKKARQTIHNIRATHMEGSFGNEKQHYGLLKIKAKLPQTQLASLVCCVLTANAMTLIGRHKKKKRKQKYKDRPNSPNIRAA